MTRHPASTTGSRWFRRVGLGLGGFATFWWVVAVVGGVLGDDTATESDGFAEGAGIVVLVVANVAAYVLSILRPRTGSWALLGTGTVFCLFALVTAGRMQWLAMLVSGGPFAVAGGLGLLAITTDRSG